MYEQHEERERERVGAMTVFEQHEERTCNDTPTTHTQAPRPVDHQSEFVAGPAIAAQFLYVVIES